MTLLCQMAHYDDGAVRVDVATHIGGIIGATQLNFVSPLTFYIMALIGMFGISATYNLWPRTRVKWWLWRMDHASIVVFTITACTLFLTTRPALEWLAAGFAVYLAGIPFLLWHRLRYHNAIWHAFVLTAAFLHYRAIA